MKHDHPDPHHHTVASELDDPRDALALPAEENADLCAGCIKCCTYISVEVDAPRAAWEYDQWIWALHHEGIELYVERPERWFVHVEARCGKLNQAGRCGIYGRHPVLCREYDPRTCERRLPLADTRAWFKTGEALEAWLKDERPAHWRALQRFRKPRPTESLPPSAVASGFVALSSLQTRGGTPKAPPVGRSAPGCTDSAQACLPVREPAQGFERRELIQVERFELGLDAAHRGLEQRALQRRRCVRRIVASGPRRRGALQVLDGPLRLELAQHLACARDHARRQTGEPRHLDAVRTIRRALDRGGAGTPRDRPARAPRPER